LANASHSQSIQNSTLPLSPSIRVETLEDRVLFDASPLGELLREIEPAVVSGLDEPIQLPPQSSSGSDDLSSYGLLELDSILNLETTMNGLDGLANQWNSLNQGSLEPDVLKAENHQDSKPSQLIVIDGSIADWSTLLKDIELASGPDTRILLLDSNRDGISQISTWISQYSEIAEVHLFAHANSGQLQLGSTRVSTDNVALFAEQWISWTDSLQAGADLLIYGCELASANSGLELVEQLSSWTGMDVAASTNLTGSSDVGGDWTLEYHSGSLESISLFDGDSDSPRAWKGGLSLPIATVVTGNNQQTEAYDRGSDRAVAMHSDGSFVVVWTENFGGGSKMEVVGQLFAANGTPAGTSFLINQNPSEDQRYAAVGMDSVGNFVVTWTGKGGLDGNGEGVFARRFAADGTALGNEFQVNGYSTNHQRNSTIAVAQDGSFVIVWEGEGLEDSYGIFGQRYDFAGAALGGNFLVNSSTGGGQFDASISINANKEFAVSWDDANGFHFGKFDLVGNPIGTQIVVSNLNTAGNGSILLNDDGSVVATWRSTISGLTQTYLKIYDPSDNLVALNLVNGFTLTDDFTNPSISGDGSGDFVITWEGATDKDVFARRFNSDGSYASSVFTVNPTLSGDQNMASVSVLSNSNFVIVWTDQGNGAPNQGVYARIFGDAPILDTAYSPALAAVDEGFLNASGTKISDLLLPGSVTAAIAPPQFGIAIVGLNTSLGTWQFSLDNGATWKNIDARLINSQVNELALHLGPTNRIRLVPFGDLNGSLTDAITFRAWNLTGPNAGEYSILVNPGIGASPYSQNTDQAAITVNAVNDAPNFDAGAGYTLNALGSSSMGTAIAQQVDGKTIVIGRFFNGTDFDIFVTRYHVNGTLDTAFGTNGSVTLAIGTANDWANAVAVQSDGKVVVAGQAQIGGFTQQIVVRLNSDGSRDNSFGSSGVFSNAISTTTNEVFDLELLTDGKILITGASVDVYRKFTLCRLTENGVLDSTFGNLGVVVTDLGVAGSAKKLEIQDDGKILVGGFTTTAGVKQIVIARYLADGTLDSSYGNLGINALNILPDSIEFNAMYLSTDGKLLVGGTIANGTNSDLILVRLGSSGAVDSTFQSVGYRIIDGGGEDALTGISVDQSGKILLTANINQGVNRKLSTYRLNSDGSDDLAYGANGRSVVTIGKFASGDAMWLQTDGSLMVTGTANPSNALESLVLRLDNNGSLDSQYNASSSLGSSVDFLENGAPVILIPNASVFDVEMEAAGNYSGSQFSAVRFGPQSSHDRYIATGTLGPIAEGGALSVNGTVIGTVLNNSTGYLLLEFNNNATQSLVNDAIRQIGFRNARLPAGYTGNIQLSLNDGNDGIQGLGGSTSVTSTVAVNVISINNAPTIAPASLTFAGGDEDAVANGGQRISELLALFGDPISDPNANAKDGIAVTSLTAGNGLWQFSLDDGASWTNVGTVSESSALLLRDLDRIRFVPNAENGTLANLTFRAWDQTGITRDAQGAKVDTSTNGGTSAFSVDQVSLAITIADVNDAPALDNSGTMTLTSISEDQLNNLGNTVSDIISSAGGNRISDVDNGAIEGIAITGLDQATGVWEFSVDNAGSWIAVGTVSDASALLLRATDRIRFVPNGDNGSIASFTFVAWDQTGGTFGLQGSKVNTQLSGGSTAFSLQSETASIMIAEANDTPLIFVAADDTNQTQLDESNASLSCLGTLSVIDVDANDVVAAYVTGVSINGNSLGLFSSPSALLSMLTVTSPVSIPSGDTTGKLYWAFNSGSERFEYLAPGQALELIYTIVVEDFQGSQSSDTVTVEIRGTNDVPMILVLSGNQDQATVSESNGSLFVTGQLTVEELDLTQTVTGSVDSVSLSGNYSGLSSTLDQLKEMLRIDSLLITSGSATGVLTWSFDSDSQAFDFLPTGQVLELIYQISVSDSLDSSIHSVTIQIIGSNDAPTLVTVRSFELTEFIDVSDSSQGYQLSSIPGLTATIGDLDRGSELGLAVSSGSVNGVWQYRNNHGTVWTNIANDSSLAVLLSAEDFVRFEPNSEQPTQAELTFRAWDKTSGSSGSVQPVSQLVSLTTASANAGLIVLDRVAFAVTPSTTTSSSTSSNSSDVSDSTTQDSKADAGDANQVVGTVNLPIVKQEGSEGPILVAQNPTIQNSSFPMTEPEEKSSEFPLDSDSDNLHTSDKYYTPNPNSGDSNLRSHEVYVSVQKNPITFENELIWTRFFDGLNQSSRDLLINQYEIGVPTFAASTASLLTVGYLAWMVRGGVLLTTFMSSIPTWKSLDIVPLIEGSEKDSETIEQMVDVQVNA
jgi:uncharacterized delta-60 repeat protein